MRESAYQGRLIKRLHREFPGCVVLKNDSGYLQGVPDLSILFGNKWAMLEDKAYEGAAKRPNQDYYVDLFNDMSYAAFIFPENEEEILRELHFAIGVPDRRSTRTSEPLQSRVGQLRRR